MAQTSNQIDQHYNLQGSPNDWASGPMNADFPPSITLPQTEAILMGYTNDFFSFKRSLE